MKFKEGDIVCGLIGDGTRCDDDFFITFKNYKKDGTHHVGDCFIIYEYPDKTIYTDAHSNCIWYRSGRHILTEVIRKLYFEDAS